MSAAKCDHPKLLSANGTRRLCCMCWTEEPAGTPGLFEEWGEAGTLNARRWVEAWLNSQVDLVLTLSGLNRDQARALQAEVEDPDDWGEP